MVTARSAKAASGLLDTLDPPASDHRGPHMELPGEDDLQRMLDSGRSGYWALVTVQVKELARLTGREAGSVRRYLARRLREILVDDVRLYGTRDGLAVLVGPGADLAETRQGTRLLRTAITAKLAEPVPAHAELPPLTFSFASHTEELPGLRVDA